MYDYFCTFHPWMLGTVEVSDAAGVVPTSAPAQPAAMAATPTAAPTAAQPPPNAVLVATGLVNPRGFAWGPDGALYVAEAGQAPTAGGMLPTGAGILCEGWRGPGAGGRQAEGCPPTEVGGNAINYTGRISRIAMDGERRTVLDGLPVTVGQFGDALGPSSLAFAGADLFFTLPGPNCGNGDVGTGVYRVLPGGGWTLIADLGRYNFDRPPAYIPPDFCGSNPYDMVSLGGKLYITDGNACVLFTVDPSLPLGANIERIADLSPPHPVLTGIAVGPDGNLYVTNLTHAPYTPGTAMVLKITPAGETVETWTGFTLGVGVAVAPDGAIYVSEFSRSLLQPPFIAPPGRIVQAGEDSTVTEVTTALTFPTVIRWGPDGLYFTDNSVGAGAGAIYRLPMDAPAMR